MSSDLRCETQGSTAFITFNRPTAHNAMTWEMYETLYKFCDTIDRDDTVRVVVLQGAGGKAFVAGTDIHQFSEFRSGEDGLSYERRVGEVVDRLEAVQVPTIAVIDGYAVGGGLVLAAACDIRVATPNSRFGLPIAKTLGNCISIGTCAKLVALIGSTRTLELVFTAQLFTAERASELGLVNEVVAAEELFAQSCMTQLWPSPLGIASLKQHM